MNGPVTIHSELPLMCDIVLASEDAYFQDLAHFVSNLSPGDGVQNILPRVIGLNRFRYWQLMGQKITAQQAYEWGLVNHVVPHAELLPYCRQLAADCRTIDQLAVRRMLATYDENSLTTTEKRRAGIMARGRDQTGG